MVLNGLVITILWVLIALYAATLVLDIKALFFNKTFKFAKLHPDAQLPYKDKENGCYDLFACFDEEEFEIPSHSVRLVPTGICSAFSSDYMIHVRERGSNTKSNLKVSAGVIDSGYRGEWFVALYNGNKLPVVISKNATEFDRTRSEIIVPYNKAIAQFAVENVPNISLDYTSVEKVLAVKSKRGTNKLGSTDKK